MTTMPYTAHESGFVLSEIDSGVTETVALDECDAPSTATGKETHSLYVKLGPILGKRDDVLLDVYNSASLALRPDWDGEGGRPVTDKVFRAAVDFVKLLPDHVDNPSVSVDPDGSFCFEWADPDGQRVSVSVGLEGKLTFAGLFADEEFCGKGRIDFDIPDSLLTGILKLQTR